MEINIYPLLVCMCVDVDIPIQYSFLSGKIGLHIA